MAQNPLLNSYSSEQRTREKKGNNQIGVLNYMQIFRSFKSFLKKRFQFEKKIGKIRHINQVIKSVESCFFQVSVFNNSYLNSWVVNKEMFPIYIISHLIGTFVCL